MRITFLIHLFIAVSCGCFADDIKIIRSVSSSIDSIPNHIASKKFGKNATSFIDHLLTRERMIAGGFYSYSVPNTKIIWPSPIPENERLFWRHSIAKYFHYQLEEKPFKRNDGINEDLRDLMWKILLFSKYPNMDLLLYLKQDEMSYPIILFLHEGKISAVDFRKLPSFPEVLRGNSLAQFVSGGMDDFNLFVNKLENSLVDFPVTNNMYSNILSTFFLVNLSAEKASYKLNESMTLYKTDVNRIREMSGMRSRITFNNGSCLTIQNRKNISTFFMLELYNKNELPQLVQNIVYSMYNGCINPKENSFIKDSDLYKIRYKIYILNSDIFYFTKYFSMRNEDKKPNKQD